MIEFKQLKASAGNFSLKSIDLRIESGSCHVIVGPTGAGKTFLIESLIGIRSLTDGQILVNDHDVRSLPPQKRQISYVPQDNCLFPNMTVKENIWFGLRMQGSKTKESQKLIDHLVEFLRLKELLNRFPANLSGGEKQRVALARALATRPALLALDEPFSAIDHSLREDIRRLLKELLAEFKTTTLIVTHDLDEAFFLGQQISIMTEGKICQTGDRESMYYYPKTREAAAFLGIKNVFAAQTVEVNNDNVLIEWPAMQCKIRVPCRCGQKRFKINEQIHFGIRSEAVFIIRPGFENKPDLHLFACQIKKFYQRGRMHTLIVIPVANKNVKIEIDIHDAAAKKLQLKEGKTITISIEPRWVFLYK